MDAESEKEFAVVWLERYPSGLSFETCIEEVLAGHVTKIAEKTALADWLKHCEPGDMIALENKVFFRRQNRTLHNA